MKMRKRDRIFIFIPVIIFSLCTLYACKISTTPNKPYAGQKTDLLGILFKQNERLANELLKLPEIQNGISEIEGKTIKRLIALYGTDPELFDAVFDKMYSAGKPEVRKYCTPLQALFWMLKENKYQEFQSLFKNYTVDKLLNLAWDFNRSGFLSEEQIQIIIQETKSETIKAEYVSAYEKRGAQTVETYMLYDFGKKSSLYTNKGKRILKEAKRLQFEGWNDFNTVVDRLNAPEIINHYTIRRLKYQYWRDIPNASMAEPDIRYVFRRNQGDCYYISAFIVHCLKKAGYHDAYIWKWTKPGGNFGWHAVAVYHENKKKWVIDNGRPNPFKVGIVPYSVYAQEK